MTLVLKELKELKAHLSDTIRILWHKHIGKESSKHTPEEELISALHEPRKSELFYLWGVMSILEARIETEHPETEKPYVEIYYGALYSTIKHIEQNVHIWQDEGLLKERLQLAIRNDKEGDATPDHYQFVDFYRSLNAFLKLIFKNYDSRNGLVSAILLSTSSIAKIPPEKLAELIHISYQFEEEKQNAIHATYVGDGKTVANSNEYRAPKDIPITAIAQFTTFQNLKHDLDELILKELGKKGVKEVSKLADLNRIRQIETLQAVANQLESTHESALSANEKIGILAGFMLMVREDIGHIEYAKTPFHPDNLPRPMILMEPPVLHTGLTAILKVKDMRREDAEALITAAKNFMVFMTVEQADIDGTKKEYTRENHMFSTVTGFSVRDTLNFMQTLIKSARSDALNQCVEKYQKDLEASLPRAKTLYDSLPSVSLPSISGMFSRKTTTALQPTLLDLQDDVEASSSTDGNEEKKKSTTEPPSTLTALNM